MKTSTMSSVYRVPLSFNWPIGQKWEGFINPYYASFIVCPHCQGLGIAKEARALEAIWYGTTVPEFRAREGIMDFGKIECEYGFIYHFTRSAHTSQSPMYLELMQRYYRRLLENRKLDRSKWREIIPSFEEYLKERHHHREIDLRINSAWMYLLDEEDVVALLEAKALTELTHEWKDGAWRAKWPTVKPTPAQVNLYSHDEWGYDLQNAWIVISAFCKRNHLAYVCPHCQGAGGAYPDQLTYVAACSWRPSGPPPGPGYQLWEPSLEGAPLSPVFESVDALVEWIRAEGFKLKLTINPARCKTFVRSGGLNQRISLEFIWLFRQYRSTLKSTFHPTLMHTSEVLTSIREDE